MFRNERGRLFSAALLAWLIGPRSEAADWPQWRGPDRTGISTETGLVDPWPEKGLPLLWQSATLGPGYSGPAIVGDRLYLMGSHELIEQLFCLSATSGKEIWRTPVGPQFKNPWGDGPRGTPTVDRGLVFALGAQGHLVCVEAATGKLAWKIDLRKDLAGKLMKGNILDVDWGYSESPLVDGEQVVVSPGGDGGTVAAFDRRSGKILWRTKGIKDAASYASAVVAEIHGVRQYVILTGGVEHAVGVLMLAPPRAIAISPHDGALLWQQRINYVTAGVINTPVVHSDHVYTSCGYGAGCTILRVEKSPAGLKANDLTDSETRRVMKTYHGGNVLAEDRVFGFSDGRGWVCQAVPSGKSLWEEKGRIGEGSCIRIDGKLLIVTMDGQVVLAKPGDEGWNVRGRFKLPVESPTRKTNDHVKVCTHPVVAHGRLYVRDQEILWCFDLRQP